MGTEPDPFFPLVGRGSFTMVRSDIAGRVAATLRTAKAGPGTAPAAPGRKSSAGATGASAKRSLSFGGFEARAVARDERKEQMVEAEAWCEKTGKGAKACLAANSHLTLVKPGALHARLTGEVVTGEENWTSTSSPTWRRRSW